MLIRNLNEFGVWTKYDQKNQNGGEFYVHMTRCHLLNMNFDIQLNCNWNTKSGL